MKESIVIFWFRRDLRLYDNAALSAALHSKYKVLPLFIFDTNILNQLENKYDRRVDYIHQALSVINNTLHKQNSGVLSLYGSPVEVFSKLISEYNIQSVYCNRDYEPYAIKRDKEVQHLLKEYTIGFYDFKDQVIFDKSEVVKADGLPYTIFTPYAKRWRALLKQEDYKPYDILFDNFLKVNSKNIHSLEKLGFEKTDVQFTSPEINESIVKHYNKLRDYPSLNFTSRLGTALRFGTISVRECVAYALSHNGVWLNELIWREFFMQILYHFPKVVTHCFKAKYEFIEWRNKEEEFKRWCEGKTGYALVDAGMQQLNKTGFMHNRVRMLTAGFLCKHLLIDWRWGEAYFAEKLIDYDLASNNGNWQWAAGCGCDAAPYFRIFNPVTQAKKFDKNCEYIKTWNPDYKKNSKNIIIDHDIARKRAMDAYAKALNNHK